MISGRMRIKKMNGNPEKTEYMITGHPRRTNRITDISFKKMGRKSREHTMWSLLGRS